MNEQEKKLRSLVRWVKEIKGITSIDLEDLIAYLPEYEQWIKEHSK